MRIGALPLSMYVSGVRRLPSTVISMSRVVPAIVNFPFVLTENASSLDVCSCAFVSSYVICGFCGAMDIMCLSEASPRHDKSKKRKAQQESCLPIAQIGIWRQTA